MRTTEDVQEPANLGRIADLILCSDGLCESCVEDQKVFLEPEGFAIRQREEHRSLAGCLQGTITNGNAWRVSETCIG